MSRVEVDVHIAAAPAEVWDVVMDPHRFDEWVTIHRKMHDVDGGPPREGMKMTQTLCIRGANFKVKWRLADCDGESHAVWEGKGPMGSHARTEYQLSPDGDTGTRFHYINEFKAPGGPLGAAASRVLVGGVPEREAHRSLERLKGILEN